jgi:hypothetical protein
MGVSAFRVAGCGFRVPDWLSKTRSASAMKWQNRIAQGFYEAELVKAALAKKYFLKVLLGLDRDQTTRDL